MNLFKNIASAMQGGGNAGAAASAPAAPVFPASVAAPSWETLLSTVKSTETGKRITAEQELRAKGLGPTHTDNKVRLFGAKSESEIRVVLYRDHAAWCPYCQKVWLLLEEKQIPYKIEKINMRSYGDKPDWFLEKVPRGLLPVIELDGKIITESIVIMQTLDQTFPQRPVLPRDEEGRRAAGALMQLERGLFGDWCGYVFQPGEFGKAAFEGSLNRVDAALRATPGPWFLGGDSPSIVDFQYISHVERMIPSALYWKGLRIRGAGRWPGIEAWLSAFEERATYRATRGDYFTHVMDIPPQYGPGQPVAAGEQYRSLIDGRAGWSLPLPPASPDALEPIVAAADPGEEGARHEAAFKLISNGRNVAGFAARAVGPEIGSWQRAGGGSRSALADPYARPVESVIPDVDVCLRHVTNALINGAPAAEPLLRQDLASAGPGGREAVATCLRYLRARVGVPRDMPYPAARQFRAHLGWAIDALLSQ